MEIRHQDIFPWNQLNIHILVVYSKTIHNWRKTLKSWRITPGGLTSSAKTNMCPIPSIWKPPFSFNFASFFLYVLAQQVKRTSTACHLFFLLQDCLCAVKRRHHWVIVAELVMSAVLLSYLDNMKILSGGFSREDEFWFAHDSHASLHFFGFFSSSWLNY